MSTEYDKNLVQNNQNLSVALGETSLEELYKLINTTKMYDVRKSIDTENEVSICIVHRIHIK